MAQATTVTHTHPKIPSSTQTYIFVTVWARNQQFLVFCPRKVVQHCTPTSQFLQELYLVATVMLIIHSYMFEQSQMKDT